MCRTKFSLIFLKKTCSRKTVYLKNSKILIIVFFFVSSLNLVIYSMRIDKESPLKDDLEYTLLYFLRCSGWGLLEKTPEKRPRIIYLKK